MPGLTERNKDEWDASDSESESDDDSIWYPDWFNEEVTQEDMWDDDIAHNNQSADTVNCQIDKRTRGWSKGLLALCNMEGNNNRLSVWTPKALLDAGEIANPSILEGCPV